jgi:hypothetical protein
MNVSAFSTIRNYHQKCWKHARSYISLPRLQFDGSTSDTFVFDSMNLSISAIQHMLVGCYEEASMILSNNLLFGFSDNELGVNLDFSTITDDLQCDTVGYGFATQSGFTKHRWSLIKAVLTNPKGEGTLWIDVDGKTHWKKSSCVDWLQRATRFKEIIYFLLHCLGGMPKRESEERRYRLWNTRERMRNFYWLLHKLAIVGMYSKTTAITGTDKLTLHFSPDCVSNLFLRFLTLCTHTESFLIGMYFPERDHSTSAVFTTLGQRWLPGHGSKVIQEMTLEYLGHRINLQQLRHCLPAIADHLNLTYASPSGDLVSDFQSGRGSDIGQRIYARSKDVHPGLTPRIVHEVYNFSMKWHDVFGFGSPHPTRMSGEQILVAAKPEVGAVASLTMEMTSLTAEISTLTNKMTSLETMMSRILSYLEPSQTANPHPSVPPSHHKSCQANCNDGPDPGPSANCGPSPVDDDPSDHGASPTPPQEPSPMDFLNNIQTDFPYEPDDAPTDPLLSSSQEFALTDYPDGRQMDFPHGVDDTSAMVAAGHHLPSSSNPSPMGFLLDDTSAITAGPHLPSSRNPDYLDNANNPHQALVRQTSTVGGMYFTQTSNLKRKSPIQDQNKDPNPVRIFTAKYTRH